MIAMSGKVTDAFKVQGSSRPGPSTKAAAAAAAAAPRAAVGLRTPSQQDEQDEALLRQFDLNSRYGPVSGITRLERWQRAQQLGLSPPPEVKALVEQHGAGSDFNKHLFDHPF